MTAAPPREGGRERMTDGLSPQHRPRKSRMRSDGPAQIETREEALLLLAFEIAVGIMFVCAWPLIALWDAIRRASPEVTVSEHIVGQSMEVQRQRHVRTLTK